MELHFDIRVQSFGAIVTAREAFNAERTEVTHHRDSGQAEITEKARRKRKSKRRKSGIPVAVGGYNATATA